MLTTTEVYRPLEERSEVLPHASDFLAARIRVAELLSRTDLIRYITDEEIVLYMHQAEHKLPNGDRLFLEITKGNVGAETGLFDPNDQSESYVVHHYSPTADEGTTLVVRERVFDLTIPYGTGKSYNDNLQKIFADGVFGKERDFEVFMQELRDPSTEVYERAKRYLQQPITSWMAEPEPTPNTYDLPIHNWLLMQLNQLDTSTAVPNTGVSWYEMIRAF